MTLNEVMKDTADAIREKTGKSELIAPVDFASEIKGITAGGSGESGGNQVVYLNVVPLKDALGDAWAATLAFIPGLLAVRINKDGVTISPLSALSKNWISYISEIAILSDFRGFIENATDLNSSWIITTLVEHGAVEITKEQFYDLNA